jgi:hypothetical protein
MRSPLDKSKLSEIFAQPENWGCAPIALDIESKHPAGSGEGLCGTLLPCFLDGCSPL